MCEASSKARLRWNLLSHVIRNGVYFPNEVNLNLRYHSASGTLQHLAVIFFRIKKIQESELGDKETSYDDQIEWASLQPVDPFFNQNTLNTKMTQLAASSISLHSRICSIDRPPSASNYGDTLETLSGFDNTGNIGVWSGELMISHSLFMPHLYPELNSILFRRNPISTIRRVCELGAGMTGLAGLAASVALNHHNLDMVLLTDGNSRCVQSLGTIAANHNRRLISGDLSDLKYVEVSVKQLSWIDSANFNGELDQLEPDMRHSFDLILVADCFYRTSGHEGLLALLDQLLSYNPDALVLAIAPERGNTFTQFTTRAQNMKGPCWIARHFTPNQFICPQFYQFLIDQTDHIPNRPNSDSLFGNLLTLKRGKSIDL